MDGDHLARPSQQGTLRAHVTCTNDADFVGVDDALALFSRESRTWRDVTATVVTMELVPPPPRPHEDVTACVIRELTATAASLASQPQQQHHHLLISVKHAQSADGEAYTIVGIVSHASPVALTMRCKTAAETLAEIVRVALVTRENEDAPLCIKIKRQLSRRRVWHLPR